ncbi:glutamate-cysteine ligase catalytic subunit [Mrakia frigida]|uniref:glutamate--cysteine ligase n=1 Tax=Mrakia frigida TaxID=29902 RepID=UPI003FCC078A
MGLLVVGTPLKWEDSKEYIEHVKYEGISQFIALYDRLKGKPEEPLLWGDEIEYIIVAFDDATKNAYLALSQTEILNKLEGVVMDMECGKDEVPPTFHPEFGRYMLESTPGAPYDVSIGSLLSVEANMRLRRKIARAHLADNEIPMTFTSWPRLGVTDAPYSDPHFPTKGDAMRSLFVGDEVINEHVRFPTLASNIRTRRGSKVAINVPIFHDTNTPRPFTDPSIPYDRDLYPGDHEAKDGAALKDHIYMDAMAFGMGCCCLQITFQATDLKEATTVYDALVPVAPIMLAMSAASPAYRGYLADVDCRWNVIAGSVDDRTPGERGLEPLKEGERRIPKSRYDSVDSYMSSDAKNRPEYNDNDVPVDEEVKKRLLDHGLDEPLAHHIAHLYIRDPLVIFTETLEQDNSLSTDHFENIQSTNWQTLRFKPPPPNSPIGWRVEFRSMEVQPTDFENAAYSIFIVLLTRAILSFGLNFYIPVSKVDENMKRAQLKDAVTEKKFFFRKSVFPGRTLSKHDIRSRPPSPPLATPVSPLTSSHSVPWSGTSATPSPTSTHFSSSSHLPTTNGNGHAHPSRASSSGDGTRPSSPSGPVEDEYEEMTVNEIINGKDAFPGLLGVVNAYLNSLDIDIGAKCQIRKYLDLVKNRANGTLMTPAAYYRRFIRAHPSYKFDSVVGAEICYDLAREVDDLERGVKQAPELLGHDYVGSKAWKC